MVQIHFLPSFDLGGLGSLALQLIRAWPVSRRHVCVAPRYSATKPDLHAHLLDAGVAPADLIQVFRSLMDPMGYVTAVHRQLGQRLSEEIVGVMHYNFSDGVWNSQVMRRIGWRGRIVSHVGTVLPNEERAWLPARAVTMTGNLFVSASEAVRAALVRLAPPPSRVGPVVWNGVDLSRWAPTPRHPKQTADFVFTGRMAPEAKDFPLLIAAFKELVAPSARLLLVGDGPRRKGYEALAAKDPRIVFLGALSPAEVLKVLQAADVFVMAALPIEGMSMALVEALAVGLPIIATDVLANREVLSAFTQQILAPREIPAMTAALQVGLDPDWQKAARFEAIRMREKFDIARVAQTYQALCEDKNAALPD